MRIVLTGGGTGGHIVPFEPLVAALKKTHQERKGKLPLWLGRSKLDIYFLGVTNEETKEFFNRLDIKVVNIPAA